MREWNIFAICNKYLKWLTLMWFSNQPLISCIKYIKRAKKCWHGQTPHDGLTSTAYLCTIICMYVKKEPFHRRHRHVPTLFCCLLFLAYSKPIVCVILFWLRLVVIEYNSISGTMKIFPEIKMKERAQLHNYTVVCYYRNHFMNRKERVRIQIYQMHPFFTLLLFMFGLTRELTPFI